MGYWLNPKAVHTETFKSFMCDTRKDIIDLPRKGIKGKIQEDDNTVHLPCLCGSECFCLEDTSSWLLGKDKNQWIEI